ILQFSYQNVVENSTLRLKIFLYSLLFFLYFYYLFLFNLLFPKDLQGFGNLIIFYFYYLFPSSNTCHTERSRSALPTNQNRKFPQNNCSAVCRTISQSCCWHSTNQNRRRAHNN